ncbi:MAG: DUF192 domain-containing protein [Flavobacteriaceae bacterium]|nr:DUF192 domain-containing protein [Flavobacteriaceae bacterium]
MVFKPLKVFIGIALSYFVVFTSCKEEQKIVEPIKIEFKKEGELTVFKSTSDTIITQFDIEIAESDYDTQTGLMHRHAMQNDRGMLFIFPDMRMRSFYMKNTYIPLDIIYLDKDRLIVSIQENAKPVDETSLSSLYPAQYVLEINSGLTKKWSIEVGDRITFTNTTSQD